MIRTRNNAVTGATPAGARDAYAAAAVVRQMFSSIAPRYDLLNHVLSFNVDRLWWRRAAQAFRHILSRPEARILDLCCGTGDMTLALWRRAHKTPVQILGADFSHPMLERAAQKSERTPLSWIEADALRLPFPDANFDLVTSAFGFRNLADYDAGLREIVRVLKPGGVIGIVDGSSTITFRYPTNPLLQAWDRLRGLQREYNTGRPSEALQLRALLREAGFARTRASGRLTTEAGPPAGSLEETRKRAQNDLIRLRGVLGRLALAQGWATREELEKMAEALIAWGEDPDAFYARPGFTAIGWA